MADETTKKPDEQLLEDILNELDMTLADESMQKKIKDIMQRGKARIEKIGGKSAKKSPCGEHGHEKWHKDSSRIKFDVFPALFCCPKGRIPLAGRCPLW